MPIYLEKFILPNEKIEEKIITNIIDNNGGYIDNLYPCRIFTKKQLSELDFANITIIYGGNGSGKSTLLNLITNKLDIKRIAPFNSSETFNDYLDMCRIRYGYDDEGYQYKMAPHESRIITSDDIFDYMLTIRSNNNEIADQIEYTKKYGYKALLQGETIKIKNLDDYEAVRTQVLARQKTLSRRQFIKKIVGEEIKLNSNGETAIDYFHKRLKNDCLYCLDEPENSLSPKYQQELVKLIQEQSRYCGCQFIIATHSPFVLSIEGAKIYDLDSTPCEIKKWWELDNPKTYFNFFYKHKNLFLNNEQTRYD